MKLILFKAFLREYKTNPKIAMMRCFIMTFKYSGIFITGVKAEDFSFNVYSEREKEREREKKKERQRGRKKKEREKEQKYLLFDESVVVREREWEMKIVSSWRITIGFEWEDTCQ